MRVPAYALIVLTALLVLCLGCFASGGDGDESAAEASPASDGGGDTEAGQAEDGKGDAGEDGDDEDEEEAVPVEIEGLGRGMIEETLRFTANLEAEDRVRVLAEAARRVRELLVEEGDVVERGATLIRLQDDEQRSNLAKVRSELDNSRREHERQKRLFAQNLISEQEFNDSNYELEQLEIRLADAERELGYTEVRAPIGGTITERLVKVGDQVSVDQYLFEIVDFESIVARLYVPEANLPRLWAGQPVRVWAQALGDRQFGGTVKRIAPVVDPQSGTVKVTVQLGGQPGLRPGMYTDVELVVATHPEALRIPKRALVYDNDQIFVYRVDDEMRAERLLVVPMLSDKQWVEPVDGLEEGDRIVVAGQAGLKHEALVSIPGEEDTDGEGAEEAATAESVAELRTSP